MKLPCLALLPLLPMNPAFQPPPAVEKLLQARLARQWEAQSPLEMKVNDESCPVQLRYRYGPGSLLLQFTSEKGEEYFEVRNEALLEGTKIEFPASLLSLAPRHLQALEAAPEGNHRWFWYVGGAALLVLGGVLLSNRGSSPTPAPVPNPAPAETGPRVVRRY